MSTRVMIVDDHPIWREGLARDLAEHGYEVVATAGDGDAAVRIAAAARPQVVLMDLQLPGLPGVAAIARILAADPSVRVLVLSASGEDADVLEAAKAGATGYLVKSARLPDLLDAVRRTAAGDAVFSPGLAGLVLGEYRRMATAARAGKATGKATGKASRTGRAGAAGSPDTTTPPTLTDREREVLRMTATGLTAREIAERLVLSHRTVQNHIHNTLQKLQLHNRAQLVRYAIEQGLE